MELLNLLTGQPAAVALAILAMYWLNRNTLEFAREKKELLDIVRAERKEWLEQAREDRRELIDVQRASIEADAEVKRELHALRNQLATIVTGVQVLVSRFGNAPGSSTTGD